MQRLKGDSRRMDCFSKQIQSFTCHRKCVGILNNSLHTEDFYGSCLATDKKLPVLDIVRAMSCTVVMIKHALSFVVMGWFWLVMLWWCSCTLRVMQLFQIMTEGGALIFLTSSVEVKLLPCRSNFLTPIGVTVYNCADPWLFLDFLRTLIFSKITFKNDRSGAMSLLDSSADETLHIEIKSELIALCSSE